MLIDERTLLAVKTPEPSGSFVLGYAEQGKRSARTPSREGEALARRDLTLVRATTMPDDRWTRLAAAPYVYSVGALPMNEIIPSEATPDALAALERL